MFRTIWCGVWLGSLLVIPSTALGQSTAAATAKPPGTQGVSPTGYAVLAQETPKGAGAKLPAFVRSLREQLTAQGADVLSTDETTRGLVPRPSVSEERLEESYRKAIQYFRLPNPSRDEDGTATLRQVLVDLEGQPDSPERFRIWVKSSLRLAYELEEKRDGPGERAEAAAIKARLHAAAPDIGTLMSQPNRVFAPGEKPDADFYSDFIQNLPVADQVSLEVTSALPGVTVFVEGRDIGTIANLGQRVSVRRQRGQTVHVSGVGKSARSLVERDVRLDTPVVSLELGSFVDVNSATLVVADGEPACDAPRALLLPCPAVLASRKLNVERVVVVTVPAGPVTRYLASTYLVADGSKVREATVDVVESQEDMDRRARDMASFLRGGEAAGKVVALFPAPPPSGWGVTRIVGVVVGAGAVGLAVAGGLMAKSANSSYSSAAAQVSPGGGLVTGSSRASYEQSLAAGDSSKSSATTMFIAAGGAAVASGVLIFAF